MIFGGEIRLECLLPRPMPDIISIITQLERQRNAINTALQSLREISGHETGPKKVGRSKGSKKHVGMSTEGRKRQIEAMRGYWAAKRAIAKKSPTKKSTKNAA